MYVFNIGSRKRRSLKKKSTKKSSNKKRSSKSTRRSAARKPCPLGYYRKLGSKRCIKRKCSKNQILSTVTGKCVKKSGFNKVMHKKGPLKRLEKTIKKKQKQGKKYSPTAAVLQSPRIGSNMSETSFIPQQGLSNSPVIFPMSPKKSKSPKKRSRTSKKSSSVSSVSSPKREKRNSSSSTSSASSRSPLLGSRSSSISSNNYLSPIKF